MMTSPGVTEEVPVSRMMPESWISQKVSAICGQCRIMYDTVTLPDKLKSSMKQMCRWVYRKTFSLDLPVVSMKGYDADRGSFGFMLGYSWNCISSFLFVYEMVLVGSVARELVQVSDTKSVGALIVLLMVLPTAVLSITALIILEGRHILHALQRDLFSCFGALRRDVTSCLSTLSNDTWSCLKWVGMTSSRVYLTVVKDFASAFRQVTRSPSDCVTAIIVSPLVILLYSLLVVFVAILASCGAILYMLAVAGFGVFFVLLMSAAFIFLTVVILAVLTAMLGINATFSVLVDSVAIFLGIFSPWTKYFFNVLGGRYRSFRGVVDAWCHSLPQAVLQAVILFHWEPSVPKLRLIRTLSVVILSGSWATLTLYVQARHFCRNLCARPTTSFIFYVKEGIFVPLFEKEEICMADLDGSNLRRTTADHTQEIVTAAGTKDTSSNSEDNLPQNTV